jgi:hypothetical protein
LREQPSSLSDLRSISEAPPIVSPSEPPVSFGSALNILVELIYFFFFLFYPPDSTPCRIFISSRASTPRIPGPMAVAGPTWICDVRTAATLLCHVFARTIACEGKCATGHHKESTSVFAHTLHLFIFLHANPRAVSFLHNDGSLKLTVKDYVFMQILKGEGKTEHDVCVSFAFHM